MAAGSSSSGKTPKADDGPTPPASGPQPGPGPPPNAGAGKTKAGKVKSKTKEADDKGSAGVGGFARSPGRKIKCDQVLPCQQCVKRDKAHLCKRQMDDSSLRLAPALTPAATGGPAQLATSTQFDAIRSSIVQLRQKLFALESLVAQFVPQEELGADNRPLYAFVKKEGPEQGTSAAGAAAATTNSDLVVASGSQEKRPSVEAMDRIREQEATVNSESDGEVEAAVLLEFLALGRDRKQDHLNRSGLRRPDDPVDVSAKPAAPAWSPSTQHQASPQQVADPGLAYSGYGVQRPPSALEGYPDQAQSEAIVRFSLERVGWQHGAVHRGSFEAECAEFFSWGERRESLVNQAWLALYSAVLCVGVKHMAASDLNELGLLSDDPSRLPKHYFDASVNALYKSDFLAKHSVFAVQAILILVMAWTWGADKRSDLIATLLSCGIRIAQHLNIHRFSSDADWEARRRRNGVDPRSPDAIKALIDREVRKRLWCALATEDWVSIPYRRTFSVHPSHATTPMPVNVLDEDLSAGNLIARPMEEPTPATKLILTFSIANSIRRFFEEVNSAGGLSYDKCLEVDKDIRQVIRTAPSYLDPAANISHLPPFVESMRNYWWMSSFHKLLIIHRTFLGRSFRDPRYTYSRRAATDAARRVLTQFVSQMAAHQPQLWTSIYHAVSASNLLLLEVFQSSTTDPADEVAEKRKEVQVALSHLTLLAPTSPIAARGVQLLSTLLAEEAKHRQLESAQSSALKRPAPSDHQAGRFGDLSKRHASDATLAGGTVSPSFSTTSLYPFQESPAATEGGTLTTEAYNSILFNTYPAFPDSYGSNGPSPGEMGYLEGNADFWRVLDASFEGTGDLGSPSSFMNPSWQ
ncbi:C6 transcription factor [Pseudohyphozyma bogoriensis]|nr:C6 transcription factor [Pseudohyphozyma bogoriensis]